MGAMRWTWGEGRGLGGGDVAVDRTSHRSGGGGLIFVVNLIDSQGPGPAALFTSTQWWPSTLELHII